jgi:hypothetical protein
VTLQMVVLSPTRSQSLICTSSVTVAGSGYFCGILIAMFYFPHLFYVY